MKFWIDSQLSPALTPWLNDTFSVQAFSIQSLGLRDADDVRIFVQLLNQLGPPLRSYG